MCCVLSSPARAFHRADSALTWLVASAAFGQGVNIRSVSLVANLGYDKLVMPKPVFIGDTLHATSEVIALRPSKSRPETGIVTFLHEAINQRGEVVCRCERSALLKKADQS